MTSFAEGVLLWLGAYTLHSVLFLGAVWLFERLWKGATPALLSTLWRTALLAGVATASLQASGFASPVAGRFAIMPAGDEIAAPAVAASQNVIRSTEASQPAAPRITTLAEAAYPPSASGAEPAVASEPLATGGPGLNWGDIGSAVLWLWAAVVSLLAFRAGFMWWAAARELRDRKPVVQGPLFERIQALAQEIGLRRLPQVSFSDRIAGPFTLPNGEICIPVWARERLPQHQLDAMLAHEMAHVLRRDSLWLAIGMAVGTVFFFQPLNALARKRIANLAELSADDWAATRAGSGRPLAECISTFVGIAHAAASRRATPEFAAAMAKPKSELVLRVERLLSNRYTPGVLPMKARLLIGVCALGFAAVMPGLGAAAHDQPPFPLLVPESPAAPEPVAAPEVPEPPEPAEAPEAPDPFWVDPAPEPAPQTQRSVTSNHSLFGDVDMTISVHVPFDYRLNAKAKGNIDLAPDGSGVAGLSNGSFLDATLDRGGATRRLRYTREGGRIERQFWVGNESRPWGPEADAFVAELMPILFRETGMNANERVDWLLKQRGPDALLAEIDLIESDSIQSRYIARWLDTASIAAPALERLIAIAGDAIDSDSQLQATLSKLFTTQKPAGRQLALLLKAAQSIQSDSQAAALLHAVGPAALGADETAAAYFEVARSIDSDSQMQSVLSPLAASRSASDSRVGQTIELAGKDIDSDSQLAALLRHAAPRVGASDALARAYLDATRSIQSDSQNMSALLSLSEEARLSPASWRDLLEAAARIDSDSQKSSLLVSVASRLPRQPDLVAAYRSALGAINSDSQYRRAEQALH